MSLPLCFPRLEFPAALLFVQRHLGSPRVMSRILTRTARSLRAVTFMQIRRVTFVQQQWKYRLLRTEALKKRARIAVNSTDRQQLMLRAFWPCCYPPAFVTGCSDAFS
jgi:hypothetical protein